MNTKRRDYDPDQDFVRVRDFLVDTYASVEQPVNWRLDRWNYARYFVIPMIGAYGKEPVSPQDSRQAIRWWEDHIRVWEDDRGQVVADGPRISLAGRRLFPAPPRVRLFAGRDV
jgi:hypothetical protein